MYLAAHQIVAVAVGIQANFADQALTIVEVVHQHRIVIAMEETTNTVPITVTRSQFVRQPAEDRDTIKDQIGSHPVEATTIVLLE